MDKPEAEVETDSSVILIVNPAHFIDTHLLICHVTFSSIGISLNLLIMLSIFLSTRLRQSHPNLLWLGVCFSNIFHLTVRLLEVLTIYFPDSSTYPILVSWLADLPNLTMTLNLLLSLIDRHLCFKYPSCYKRIVTKKLIVSVQIGSFILLFFIAKSRYLFAGVPVHHVFKIPQFPILCSIFLSFFLICVICHFILSIKNKPQQNSYSTQERPKTTVNDDELATITDDQLNNEDGTDLVSIGNRSFNRLDFEASQNAKESFKEYLGFLMPELVAFVILAACIEFSPVDTSPADCAPLIWVAFYLRGFLLNFHSAVYNPVAFILRSHDIRSVLKQTIVSKWNSFISYRRMK